MLIIDIGNLTDHDEISYIVLLHFADILYKSNHSNNKFRIEALQISDFI